MKIGRYVSEQVRPEAEKADLVQHTALTRDLLVVASFSSYHVKGVEQRIVDD